MWPTFESYLLAVQIRDGEIIRVYAEPLVIEDYTPKGVTGDLADFVARRTVGLSSGDFVVDHGAVESNFNNDYTIEQTILQNIDFDDLAIIAWASEADTAANAQYNYIQLVGNEAVTLNKAILTETTEVGQR